LTVGTAVLSVVVQASSTLVVVALILVFVRLVRGPDIVDRIVALDLIAILAAAVTAITAIRTNEAVLLDAAIVMALVAFLGTVAVARYVEKRLSR